MLIESVEVDDYYFHSKTENIRWALLSFLIYRIKITYFGEWEFLSEKKRSKRCSEKHEAIMEQSNELFRQLWAVISTKISLLNHPLW